MARKPSPDDLRKLKEKATEAAAKGKFDKAAELFREAADADPRDAGTRQKLAESLRRGGRIPEAIQAYQEVADRFAQDGLLIKAIAISKTILELDPEHVETQAALAELYARRAQGEAARPAPRTLMVQAMKAVAAPPPAAAAPAAPPPRPVDDAVVAIALGPPPAAATPPPPDAEAVEITIEPEALAPSSPGAGAVPPPPAAASEPEPILELVPELVPEPEEPPTRPQPAFEAPAPPRRSTAFAQIVQAAEDAVAAGVEEDLLVVADPEDGPVLDDEPLGPPDAAADRAEPPPPEVEILVEPERPQPAPEPEETAQPQPAQPEPAPALPRVPIFSDLGRDAFLALTAGMVLHRVEPGEAVIREGDEGTSFYVVAGGRLAVSRRDEAGGGHVVLAHLHDGDFFGEMALLSGAPRSATVAAEVPSEVLEFRAERLLDVAGHHPHVAQSLRKFYRQRLLANALALSPVFRPFERGERKLIMARFRAREVDAGEVVIREGQPSDGLYVVLEGAVDVVKATGGQEVLVGQLREGDLFGEMSCLRKAPASATVVVRRPGTLLRLPRKEFDALVTAYPQILELVATLSEERAENLDAILSGHAEWTDEGLVLT